MQAQPMTNQTAFNIASVALLTQNAFSMTDDGNICAYRDADGNKCAIGHLIPDELYEEVTEGLDVIEMLRKSQHIALLLAECEDQFLTDLQNVHDEATHPETFSTELLRLAAEWHLDASCITNFFKEGESDR